MTQTKITRSFNIPLLDSFLKPISDKPSDIVEKLINSINNIVEYDKEYTSIKDFKDWSEKYDLIYKDILNQVEALNSETIQVKLYHILLFNVINNHEGSKSIFEIETIGKLQKQLNDATNNHTVELTIQEAIFFKKIILESKVKTSFKCQILEHLSDIKE